MFALFQRQKFGDQNHPDFVLTEVFDSDTGTRRLEMMDITHYNEMYKGGVRKMGLPGEPPSPSPSEKLLVSLLEPEIKCSEVKGECLIPLYDRTTLKTYETPRYIIGDEKTTFQQAAAIIAGKVDKFTAMAKNVAKERMAIEENKERESLIQNRQREIKAVLREAINEFGLGVTDPSKFNAAMATPCPPGKPPFEHFLDAASLHIATKEFAPDAKVQGNQRTR